MNQNRLKMNTEKTEFTIFGPGQNLLKCLTENINVCGDIVECSKKIRLLGMWVDTALTFKNQISMNVVQLCSIYRKLGRLDLFSLWMPAGL